MQVRNEWWKRAWAWCVEAARETAACWRPAAALLRRDLWRPLALIVVLSFLPNLLYFRIHGANGIFYFVHSFVLVPLLFAALAQVQLTALWGGSVSLADTVREKARQWRELLMLAFFGVMMEQMGAFVTGTVSRLVLSLLGLVTWIPLLGPLLGAVFSALVMLLVIFVGTLSLQGVYFAWLMREAQRTPVLLTLSTTWGFVKEHARPIVGLYACFAIVRTVLELLPRMDVPMWWPHALSALILLLGTSYAAALFAAAMGPRAHTPPDDLGNMKRANIPEE